MEAPEQILDTRLKQLNHFLQKIFTKACIDSFGISLDYLLAPRPGQSQQPTLALDPAPAWIPRDTLAIKGFVVLLIMALS